MFSFYHDSKINNQYIINATINKFSLGTNTVKHILEKLPVVLKIISIFPVILLLLLPARYCLGNPERKPIKKLKSGIARSITRSHFFLFRFERVNYGLIWRFASGSSLRAQEERIRNDL